MPSTVWPLQHALLIGKKRPKKKHDKSAISITESPQLALCMTLFYASILAIATVAVKRRWSQVVVKHLHTVLVSGISNLSYLTYIHPVMPTHYFTVYDIRLASVTFLLRN
jgi:hypothetical protein